MPKITCPECQTTFAFQLRDVDTGMRPFSNEASEWLAQQPMTANLKNALVRAAQSVDPGGTITLEAIQSAL
jgi:hypothetical protein